MAPTLHHDALTPLMTNCLFRSDVRVTVHDQVARELSDHSLRWRRGAPDAAMYKGQTDHLHVYLLRYGAEVEVTPKPFNGFSLVHTSLAGGVEIESDGHRLYVAEGHSAVVSPQRDVRLHWQPGTVQLIVRVPHALVREVTGMHEDEAVQLAPGCVVPREHTGLWNLQTAALLNALALPEGSPMRAAWLTNFERSVAMFLVAQSQEPPAARPVDRAGPPIGSLQARRIEAVRAYIDAHLAAPIALEDLARAGTMSVRTLNHVCDTVYGVSPMTWVRHRRLDAANSHLKLHPGASIAETAQRVGFGHVGRFASYYKARFGELPSQTATL